MLDMTIAKIVQKTYEWDMYCWPKYEHRYNVEILLDDSWYGEQIYYGPYESMPTEFSNIRPINMYTTCGGKRTIMHFGIPRNWDEKPCVFDRFLESESGYIDLIDELEARFDAA